MAKDDQLPIIIGVGQYVNRSEDLEVAREPVEMMAIVASKAEEDAAVPGVLAQVDSLQVVNILSWPYEDAPALLAQRLGASPKHTLYSSVGGDTPQRLVNETADRIAGGKTRLALLAGGEAMHSFRLARRRGVWLPWPPRTPPRSMVGDARLGHHEVEAKHGATVPIRIYPLFENALRAHKGLTLEAHRQRLGQLCARLSQVAAANPYAWFPEAKTAEEIATVSPTNRMVCFPYPKLMNAIMEVDQAACLLMTSVAAARALGIPEDRWVYFWGGAEAVDKWYIGERANYYSSPALAAAVGTVLARAGLRADEVDLFDLYSCFPSAVQLAMDALALDLDDRRPLTVTGGLPYAGGPGNNYSMHAIAAMVERLRRQPEQVGMVTAMGWYVTKHVIGIYSGRPPGKVWPGAEAAALPKEMEGLASPPFLAEAKGQARIETYTVAFGREGQPEQGIVIGRLSDGSRFIANTEPDPGLLQAMTEREMVGAPGHVSPDPASGRNVFRL